MGWFQEWWQGLALIGQIFALAAIPMTVVMILQAILMVIGFGGFADASDLDAGDFDGGDTDVDAYEAASESGGSSYGIGRLLTVRGVVAFFALGGWAGLAALSAGLHPLWSVQIALLSGVAAMILAAAVIRLAFRMQSSGNIDLQNAVSLTADVYITIPPSRSNSGKVTVLLQERFVELEAVTDSETAIKPHTKVEVIGLEGSDRLVVRPVSQVDLNRENTKIEREV